MTNDVAGRYVRLWHLADNPTGLTFVRSWFKSEQLPEYAVGPVAGEPYSQV